MSTEIAKPGRTPLIVELLGGALGIFGLLWITCFFVSGGSNPVPDAGQSNLAAGIALVVTGALMVARGEVLRRRDNRQ